MTPDTTAIILLGAGRSSRFGGEKLLAPMAGRRVLDWALDAALESGLRPVILVTRPDLASIPLPKEVHLKVNPHPEEGLSASIRSGIQAAEAANCRAAIFAPADQPLLHGEVYRRLVRSRQAGHPIAVASFDGQIRNPVLLGVGWWDAANLLQGDQGLSRLIRTPGTRRVECGDIASVTDIDTPADLTGVEEILSQRRTG